ncbi:MAG: sterol desaturase family protein [Saprospiraceae bacterium]|nr:sterol desaturase family protein [Saprospiraceae bacterium]
MEFLRSVDPGTIEWVGGYILIAFVLFFIVLERLFPYTRGQKIFRKGFWMDLVWYTLIQSYVLKILIFDYIIAPLKQQLNPGDTGLISHWPLWALWLFFLVTHDFYIYWFHRWQHHSRILWRTHEAHHSVRNVDWLAGSRSHAIEILINQTIEFLPIFLLLDVKTAAVIVPIKALTDAVWGMWIHANIDAKTGRLQYIINGPEMHQWHHANHKEVFYANYATKFAFFDWIFGTAFLPGLKPFRWPVLKPLSFGLPYAYPQDFFSQSVFAFFRFDFKSLSRSRIYRLMQNARALIIRKLFPKSWQSQLMDEDNPAYRIDEVVKSCPECGHTMKHYYDQTHMEWVCENCLKAGAAELVKFGIG